VPTAIILTYEHVPMGFGKNKCPTAIFLTYENVSMGFEKNNFQSS
jgi:hypothetical protein